MNLVNIIGKGAQAEVYLHKSNAVKIFYDKPKKDAEYEAKLQALANQCDLPVPAVHKIISIGNRAGIVMEYIDGELLGNIILGDLTNMPYYIEKVVELQLKMHQCTGDDFPNMKDKFIHSIKTTSMLTSKQKRIFLKKLNKMQFANHLCHGDFHLMNLVQTKEQDIYIIDWANASCGSPIVDVCNTYLIFILISDELAQLYLNLYCEKSNLNKEDILELLPLVASTKLSENIPEKDIQFLLKIVNDYIASISFWKKWRFGIK